MTLPVQRFRSWCLAAGLLFPVFGVVSCQTTQRVAYLDNDEPAPPGFYRVKNGDSLSSIAGIHGVPAVEIMKLNALGTRPLKVGQLISIPLAGQTAAPVSVVNPPAAASPAPGAATPSGSQKVKPSFPEVALPKPAWAIENVALAGLSSTSISTNEATSLTEVLQNTLADTGYFRIRARSDIDAILKEQSFQKNQSCEDPAYLVEVGKLLATRKMVGGSIGKVGNTYVLSLRMVNVETGEIEVSEQEEMDSDADYLIDLTKYVGRLMAQKYANKASANP